MSGQKSFPATRFNQMSRTRSRAVEDVFWKGSAKGHNGPQGPSETISDPHNAVIFQNVSQKL